MPSSSSYTRGTDTSSNDSAALASTPGRSRHRNVGLPRRNASAFHGTAVGRVAKPSRWPEAWCSG